MFAHRWYVVIESLWHDLRRHGWRALLTPTFQREDAAGTGDEHDRARRQTVIALLFAAGAAAIPATADAQGVVSGYVSEIGGASGDCLIVRGSETIPVQYWTEIRVGDQVSVRGPGFVAIAVGDDASPLLVTRQNSPLRIAALARRGMLLQGLDWARQALTDWSDSEVVEAKTRGVENAGQLDLPLLAGSTPARIVAGERRFSLAWVGGTPPFRVTLIGPSGASVLDLAAAEERRVSATLRLAEGDYEAQVTDRAGLKVIGAFEATATAPGVDTSDLATLPPGMARLLAAARLSELEDGAWRLEAFLRLAEATRNDRVARMMADRLSRGLPLSELNQR
jgi:hypothetical protein